MEELIIVDRQHDFSSPTGTLYVQGSDGAKVAIINYINKNAKNIVAAICTVDWHSPNHCSFKRNGGEWPAHCQQFSIGAGIDTDIYNALILNNIPIRVFKKGNVDSTEEYGAFENIHVSRYSNEEGDIDVIVNNAAMNNALPLDCFTLTVCGTAGDYCVKETIKNLINFKGVELNVQVMLDGIASIDDGTTIRNFVKENNLKTV